MEELAQQILAGLANGAIYALMALALVMIYAATGHINFAQGEMAMFSTYLAFQATAWGAGFWPALMLAAALSFAAGVGIERVVLRPLHRAPALTLVVVTIGLLVLLRSLASAIWTPTVQPFPSPFPAGSVLGSGLVGWHQVGMLAVSLTLVAALFVFFRFTSLGLAMRAAAENPVSARLAGIAVDRMLALGWGLAAAIGAVAGVLIAPVVFLEPSMMSGILLYAFAAALVGGISNPAGAIAGGFAVGVLENLVGWLGNVIERSTGVYIVGNGEKLTIALVIVVTVLLVRPQGLIGRATARRV